MKLQKRVKRLVESSKPIDFMTLMRKTIRQVNEAAESTGDIDTEAGLDELQSDSDTDSGTDLDDEDIADLDTGRSTVTITIPVDASIQEIMDAIEEAQADEDADNDEIGPDEDADVNSDDLDAELDAAEQEFDEDEEAFAATYSDGPTRKQHDGKYTNGMTIKSNINPNIGMGKPAVYTNAAPTRQRANTTYANGMTIKSKINKDTRIFN